MLKEEVLSVSELTRHLKELVESNFSSVCVLGEISNCTQASSGHIYMTLKDEDAQLRAVMWRSRAERLKFEVEDGMEVIAVGPVEVYQARGSYQLIVQQLHPQGVGPLEIAFRQMQEKLAAEGLFDPERKRPIPQLPKKIAIITSPTSAAVRDMLQVISRRWKAVEIVVIPVAVQGDGAAGQIAEALLNVHRIPDVDVVIIGRGGGSLEDLWAFNEEVVARAIVECPIPVISAVGHEIDVSISDLVADRRALTPSEAGEFVVPDASEVRAGLKLMSDRLVSALKEKAVRSRLELDALSSRRVISSPLERIHDLVAGVDELDKNMKRAFSLRLERSRQQLSSLASTLDALSPLKVLKRGYSMTKLAESGSIITNIENVNLGDEIITRLSDGELLSKVTEIRNQD